MGLLVGIGVAAYADVDLEIGELTLQLGDHPVEAVTGPGVEARVERHDLVTVGADAREPVDQVRAERQGGVQVLDAELAGTWVLLEFDLINLLFM